MSLHACMHTQEPTLAGGEPMGLSFGPLSRSTGNAGMADADE